MRFLNSAAALTVRGATVMAVSGRFSKKQKPTWIGCYWPPRSSETGRLRLLAESRMFEEG